MDSILFAGADPTLSAAVRDSLSEAGYKVRLAHSVQTTWDALLCNPTGLVLVDARMDGALDLCRSIRAARTTPLVVVLPHSGDTPDNGLAYLEAGADYLLPLPVNRRELLARVLAVFRRRHTANPPDAA